MRRIIGLIAVFIWVGACATSQICETVPEGQTSVICEASQEVGVSPESLSQVLIITNIATLEANVYTAQEALEFIEGCERALSFVNWSTLTYGEVVDYLLSEYANLPPQVQAVFIVVDPLSSMTQIDRQLPNILSEFDIDLILTHLEKQKTIVKIYL